MMNASTTAWPSLMGFLEGASPSVRVSLGVTTINRLAASDVPELGKIRLELWWSWGRLQLPNFRSSGNLQG